jgi:hypothetical protein
MNIDRWVVQWWEKAQPLNMIHMEVAQKDVDPSRRRCELSA